MPIQSGRGCVRPYFLRTHRPLDHPEHTSQSDPPSFIPWPTRSIATGHAKIPIECCNALPRQLASSKPNSGNKAAPSNRSLHPLDPPLRLLGFGPSPSIAAVSHRNEPIGRVVLPDSGRRTLGEWPEEGRDPPPKQKAARPLSFAALVESHGLQRAL